ncbi:MAG: trypsin-like serine protease [Phycisphaerales bacterium]|nr:trypsin-like serine protease [Phycisphaerales bacterium]
MPCLKGFVPVLYTLVLAMSAAAVAAHPLPPEGPRRPIDSTSIADDRYPIPGPGEQHDGGTPASQRDWSSSTGPDIDDDGRDDPRSSSDVVRSFDLLTATPGSVSVKSTGPRRGGRHHGWRGPDGGHDTVLPRGFGSMSLVEDYLTFPARSACKLWVRNTPSSNPIGCSGILIDPWIVLTAGHCIYEHGDLDDWVAAVEINPGTQQGEIPWGTANGVAVYAPGGYIDDQDYDFDVAIIILDRPIGMLTGWPGWQSGVGCGYIEDHGFANYAYPVEDCDDGGPLHNGLDLYVWSGTFDDCEILWDDWEVDFDMGEGCFDRLWKGMSGSAAITHDGEWLATAVASHRDPFWDTADFVRIDYDFGEVIEDTIAATRGTQFDLHAMSFRSESTVTAGQEIAWSEFFACNPTNGSDQGYWTYHVMLSSDDVISYQDTQLDLREFQADFPAMGWEWITSGPVTIPINTPTGEYWLGALVSHGADANDDNNQTSGWDAQRIQVTGGPEVFPTVVMPAQFTLVQGGTIDIECTLYNQGGEDAPAYPVEIRLSENQIITASDFLLGELHVNGHSHTDYEETSGSLTIPEDCPPGVYFVGAIASADGDLDTSNDAMSSFVMIAVIESAAADECDDAIHIAPGLIPFSTVGAQTDGADHDECKYDGPHNDIWFKYTPTSNSCRIRATTCEQLGGTADFDTSITMYQGHWCSGLILLGCNDDDWNHPCGNEAGGWRSTLDVDVNGITPVWIRLGGHFEGDWGTGELNLEVRPINDACSDALELDLGLCSFDTNQATTDGQAHDECQWDGQTHNDVWYRLVAPRQGLLTVTTCEELGGTANYDTDIVIYRGSCDDLVLLGCNDDDTDNDCGEEPDYRSTAQAMVNYDDELYIRVGGYGPDDRGSGTMVISLAPPNDDCDDAQGLVLNDWLFYDNTGATSTGPDHPTCEANGDNGSTSHDIWYTFTAPYAGVFTADTCGNVDHDSDLVLYRGDCDELILVACNDDACDAPGLPGSASLLQAPVNQGQTYLLRVGSAFGNFWFSTGAGTLWAECLRYAGDANGNGSVDIADLLMVLDNWGGLGPDGDLNGDWSVDIDDLLEVIGNWS